MKAHTIAIYICAYNNNNFVDVINDLVCCMAMHARNFGLLAVPRPFISKVINQA